MTDVGGIRAVAAVDVKDWKSGIDYLKASLDVSTKGLGDMSKNLGAVDDRFREGTTGGLKLGMAFSWLEGVFKTLSVATAGFGVGLLGYMTGALALSPHFSRFISQMGVPFRELGRYLGEKLSPFFDKIVTLAGLFVGKLIQIGNETGIFDAIASGLGKITDALIKVVQSEEFEAIIMFLATSTKKVIDFELNVLDKYGLLGLLAQPAVAIALAVTMAELLGVGAGGLAGWLASKLLIPTTSIKAIAGGLVISGILILAEMELAKTGDWLAATLVGTLATTFAAVTLGPAGAVIAGGITIGVVFSGLVEETAKMKDSMLELGKLVDEHKVSVESMAEKYGIVYGIVTLWSYRLYEIKKLLEDIGLIETKTKWEPPKLPSSVPESSVVSSALMTVQSANKTTIHQPQVVVELENSNKELIVALKQLTNTLNMGVKLKTGGGGQTTATKTAPNHM